MESRGYGFDEDHPRVCGEKRMAHPCLHLRSGSPPRMRGKVQKSQAVVLVKGITPAYAGKSSGLMQKSGTNGDHPRVCGEKHVLFLSQFVNLGSPPRMRGKGLVRAAITVRLGITPAYAGKSSLAVIMPHAPEDHPRVCGEKDGVTYLVHSSNGITPAYAGKSMLPRFLSHPLRDHPRVCGEKFRFWFLGLTGLGSPPRMRGKEVYNHIK